MNGNVLKFSYVWFVASILVALMVDGIAFLSHAFLVICVSLSYLICIFSWIKCGSRALSLYSFFLAYSFLCNCAQPLLYIFNVPVEFLNTYGILSLEEVSYSLRFQFVCIAALNLGNSLALQKKKYCMSTKEMELWYKSVDNSPTKNDKLLYKLMLVLLLGTLYATYDLAKVRGSMTYQEWSYGGSDNVQNHFYFSYFFCFLSLRSVLRKQHVLFIYICWLFFVVLFMMLGLRSTAIPYLSLFLIVLPLTNGNFFRKKYIPVWLLGGFFSIILMGIISAGRYQERVDLSTVDTSQGVRFMFYSAMSDVGSPGKTLGMTMKMCDNGVPKYQSILYSVVTVIPHRVFKIPFPENEPLSSPGAYLSNVAGMEGYGFSFLSEAYYNLGWFGWLFILLYGFLIARMENMAYYDVMRKGNFFKLTFLLYLTKQIFFARGDFCLAEAYIEYMVFTAIIYKLFLPKQKLFS